MAQIIDITEEKERKLNSLNEQLINEMNESDLAVDDYKKNGCSSIEEAKLLWEKLTKPGNTRKKIHKLNGDRDYKTTEEEIEEMFSKYSDKEIASGLLIVR